MNKIDVAFAFARKKHEGQLDDEGKDYFMTHPVQVFEGLKKFTNNTDTLMTALLHDTLEDTETTYDELVQWFGDDVAQMVYMVTHDGEKDQHGYYFPRLNPTKHNYTELLKNAVMIKLADRLSNVSRMDGWAVPRRGAYLAKTIFWKVEGKDPCKGCDGESYNSGGVLLCATNCPRGVVVL